MHSDNRKIFTQGAILDLDSLGPGDLRLDSLLSTLPHWRQHGTTEPEEVEQRLRGCEIVITNKVVINAAAMAANPQLKLICVAATGTNNVDISAAKHLGISVCNVVNYGARSVAQHALMLMLNLATNAQKYSQSAINGHWSQSPFFCLLDYPIVELAGKTLGIVGFGAIGRQVAALGQALGMDVIISARTTATAIATSRYRFEDVLAQSDVISLHCPLTDETRHIINARTLGQMKPSTFLINCARGGLIDEGALAQALRQGSLAGAGLDTLSQEPPASDHPLLAADIPNLIITPHSAWASREARQNLVNILAGNIQAFIEGRPQNRV